ncbi:hypothetical protein KDA_18220 [Dictyobacter alpinus]|uniref:Uncharacterized protein n=1 Tax=Dictyobacter alpinus TaxID=2014873 RepID=A0A402B4R6_9CHLR|nr:hypothetical protein KDA_18220 [Dictyobacter alpinus]
MIGMQFELEKEEVYAKKSCKRADKNFPVCEPLMPVSIAQSFLST